MSPKLVYWCVEIPEGVKPVATKMGWPRPEGVACDSAAGRLFTLQRFDRCDLCPSAATRWIKVPEVEGLWLGVDPEGSIAPEHLRKEEVTYQSHPVMMGGMRWEIPVARLLMGGSGLPSVRALGKDGCPCWKVLDAFQDLSVYAEKVFDQLAGGEAYSDVEGDEMLALAIGVGYRLNLFELLALEIVTPEACGDVAKALIDFPAVEKLQAAKKKSGRRIRHDLWKGGRLNDYEPTYADLFWCAECGVRGAE